MKSADQAEPRAMQKKPLWSVELIYITICQENSSQFTLIGRVYLHYLEMLGTNRDIFIRIVYLFILTALQLL